MIAPTLTFICQAPVIGTIFNVFRKMLPWLGFETDTPPCHLLLARLREGLKLGFLPFEF